jgi:hypothetical protein
MTCYITYAHALATVRQFLAMVTQNCAMTMPNLTQNFCIQGWKDMALMLLEFFRRNQKARFKQIRQNLAKGDT